MRHHFAIFALAILIVAVLILSTITYQVDEMKDIVLIKTFGKVTGEPLMGKSAAGMHMKYPWPIQKAVRYDSRLSVLEDPYEEVATADKQNVILNMFCTWRIGNPVLFDAKAPSVKKAEEGLRARLMSIKSNIVVKYPMSEIINTDPARIRITEIEDRIFQEIRRQAMDDYGIEVTRVGLKVLGLSEQVSPAVIDAQIKERQQEAEAYRSAGEAQATAITEWAKSASALILSFAQRRAENIKTEGVRDAAKYYSAFSKNERLSMFLRALDSLKKELSSRSVIILDSSHNPALDFLYTRPSLEKMKVPDASQKPQSEGGK